MQNHTPSREPFTSYSRETMLLLLSPAAASGAPATSQARVPEACESAAHPPAHKHAAKPPALCSRPDPCCERRIQTPASTPCKVSPDHLPLAPAQALEPSGCSCGLRNPLPRSRRWDAEDISALHEAIAGGCEVRHPGGTEVASELQASQFEVEHGHRTHPPACMLLPSGETLL